jgi:hypothetical protein
MVGVTFALNPATRPSVSRRVAYTDSTCSKPDERRLVLLIKRDNVDDAR